LLSETRNAIDVPVEIMVEAIENAGRIDFPPFRIALKQPVAACFGASA
jgi:hypothetical protein